MHHRPVSAPPVAQPEHPPNTPFPVENTPVKVKRSAKHGSKKKNNVKIYQASRGWAGKFDDVCIREA